MKGVLIINRIFSVIVVVSAAVYLLALTGLLAVSMFIPLMFVSLLGLVSLVVNRKSGEKVGGKAFLPAAFVLRAAWCVSVWLGSIANYFYNLNFCLIEGAGYDGLAEAYRMQLSLALLTLIPLTLYVAFFIRPTLGWLENFKMFFNISSPFKKKKNLTVLEGGQDGPDDPMARERVLRKLGLSLPEDDIVICRNVATRRPVAIANNDRYLHTLVTGPTGAGKTSRILKPMVEQELKAIARSLVRGIPRGLTVIEPKGDFAADVAEMAHYYNVPVLYVDPLRKDTSKFNPLEGDPILVAEATRTVLQATFGRQEAFYSKVQEIAARNTVLLLKYLRRDDVTMNLLSQVLRDYSKLREEVNRLKDLCQDLDDNILEAKRLGNEDEVAWYSYLKSIESRLDDLVSYFEVEVLGDQAQKTHQFAMGLRLQVEDIAGNELLSNVINCKSDINLDVHLNRGGVLVINTAMGHLGKVGDVFGQFIIMHLQNAVFRRKGTEFTRARHMLIMDEAHRYINPDFERLLAMGRGVKCECVLALQNTAQLALDEKRSFRDSVLNLCRNKIVFGGMDFQEAKFFANEFGENETVKMQKSYGGTLLYKQPWKNIKYQETPNQFEQRFNYTSLIELPAYHVVYRIVKDGMSLVEGAHHAVGCFVYGAA